MKTALHLLPCVMLVVLAAFTTVGCSKKDSGKKDSASTKDGTAKKGDEHGHDEDHKTWLFATANDDFHIRLKVDMDEKTAHADVLDADAKDAVAIKADAVTLTIKNGKPEQIALKAEKVKDGMSSHFMATHDKFGAKLDAKKIEMSVEIGGKNRVFTLDEHGHDVKKK